MAHSPRTDDLFEGSKMSFGAHLDELRTCLVRALLGLGAGFVIALIFANHLVAFVKLPLEEGLKNFYVDRDSTKMAIEFGLNDDQKAVLRNFMLEHQVAPELRIFEAQQLASLLKQNPAANEYSEEAKFIEGEWWPDAKSPKDKPPLPTMMKVRVWKPLVAKIVTLSGPEAFLIWVKAAVIGGFVLASPWIFYQLWIFVAAGLYPHERGYVYVYIPFSIILFLSGAAMAFFVVFDFVLEFLFQFNVSMGLEAEPRISEWLSFVLILPVGFGIAFQLPLVMLLLYRVGIFTIDAYVSKWRIAVLVIFVLSMFLTPADPISMIAMALPLTFLYFLGIVLCHYMPRTRNPFGETGYDPGADKAPAIKPPDEE
ncbi:MAG: twin-arginine translocase subunit TatC [Planctomycetales bacterium]|nr:twin-arginine translocase subunit TatC [Planctomycetales bacterium]